MKKLITVLSITLCLNLAHAGNESGHGGDPLSLEFHHRAKFVLSELIVKQMVGMSLIQVFKEAVVELRVEMTNMNLPQTGWVVDDPKRPGKKMVLLDRKKYIPFIKMKDSIDVNLFVAHEVFETKGYDINKEITQNLGFTEDRFIIWYKNNFGVAPPSVSQSAPLCFFDRDQHITITIDVWAGEAPGEIDVKFPVSAEGEAELFSKGASEKHPGTHEVVLKHEQGNSGKIGVELISRNNPIKTKYYELEFRKTLDKCSKGGHFEIEYQ